MFIYLASPYTHLDPSVCYLRFLATEYEVAQRLRKMEVVFSPIVHCHGLVQHYNLPKNAEYWAVRNMDMLAEAARVEVLMLPGWKESEGISDEVEMAGTCSIPVTHVEPSSVNAFLSALQKLA